MDRADCRRNRSGKAPSLHQRSQDTPYSRNEPTRSFDAVSSTRQSNTSVTGDPEQTADHVEQAAASLDDIDARASSRLRTLAQALRTGTGRQSWSDVDLHRVFNADRLAHAYAVRREGGYASRSIEVADKVRNVLILMPILLTWAALAEAVAAYGQYLEANPEERGQPFLLLWQQGFGGEASPFSPTFSTVAFVAAAIIAVIVLLTFYTHGRREAREDAISDTSAAFHADFDTVLSDATIVLGTDRSARPIELTQSVERLAERFERSSQELLTQLQVEHDRLENVASQREQETSDFGAFASSMRAGSEEMHRLLVDLRQVSSGLERSLNDLSSELSVSGDQQRTLLTAVTNLERQTSSAIQSDQAMSRQLAQTARVLAEAADSAVTGADTAAQAGRAATEAVRGISELAQQIAASQGNVEELLTIDRDASSTLAEALRTNTGHAQSTARTLNDIGGALQRMRDDFDRLGSQTNQQQSTLASLLTHQAEIAQDISQSAKELGSVGLTTAQRQRESSQDLQHLIQRLDGLANTLNRLVQQSPNVETIQTAFSNALRGEVNRRP